MEELYVLIAIKKHIDSSSIVLNPEKTGIIALSLIIFIT